MTLPRPRTEAAVAGFDVAEIDYPTGFAMVSHCHSRPYVTVVLAGTYLECCGGRWHRRFAGEAIFRPSRELHASRFSRGDARCLRIRFEPAALAAEPVLATATRSLRLRGRRLRRLGERVAGDLQGRGPRRESRLAESVRDLLRETARRTSGADRRAPWADDVRARLEATSGFRLPLAELARASGVHVAHLAREFRRRHGCSVGEFARRLRVEDAARRLADPREPIAAIALACGFADQSHLTRVFRAVTGETPARFRRRITSPTP